MFFLLLSKDENRCYCNHYNSDHSIFSHSVCVCIRDWHCCIVCNLICQVMKPPLPCGAALLWKGYPSAHLPHFEWSFYSFANYFFRTCGKWAECWFLRKGLFTKPTIRWLMKPLEYLCPNLFNLIVQGAYGRRINIYLLTNTQLELLSSHLSAIGATWLFSLCWRLLNAWFGCHMRIECVKTDALRRSEKMKVVHILPRFRKCFTQNVGCTITVRIDTVSLAAEIKAPLNTPAGKCRMKFLLSIYRNRKIGRAHVWTPVT